MLGKLIKHDFRALSRTLFPLQIGVLAGGLLATLLTALVFHMTRNASAAPADGAVALQTMLVAIAVTISVLIAVAIAASAFITLLLICAHFYKNFLGDEGYLTFTLPVSTGKLLWSKLITGMVWMAINLAVICVTILIFAVFGATGLGGGMINHSTLEAIKYLFTELLPKAAKYVNLPLAFILVLVTSVLALAAQMLEIYFAILVGGQIAKKHRVLAAIGMYLLINMGVSTISSVFSGTVMLGTGVQNLVFDTARAAGAFVLSAVGWMALLLAGLSVLFFLTSRSILRRNLNLQ